MVAGAALAVLLVAASWSTAAASAECCNDVDPTELYVCMEAMNDYPNLVEQCCSSLSGEQGKRLRCKLQEELPGWDLGQILSCISGAEGPLPAETAASSVQPINPSS